MNAPRRPDLAVLVERAARAPSSHNTQPWLFRGSDRSVSIHPDRTRALPVNDPEDRELAISLGAASWNLEVAAEAAGFEAAVELGPSAAESDALVSIRLSPRDGEPDARSVRLARQIERRFTTRKAFEADAVPAALPPALASLAEAHGVWLESVEDEPMRNAVASLVAEGDRMQFADPSWRRELASWLRPRGRGDGLATPALAAPVSRWVVRTFDLGRSTARSDERLAREAPLLLVLGTENDHEEAWLRTGRALEAMLLRAAEDGVAAGYLNQPCQVAELRPLLPQALGRRGVAQLVVRLGRAKRPAKPSARRPLDEIWLGEGTARTSPS